jgi:predicted metal-dependent hydrolase
MERKMQVRVLQADFSTLKPHWAENKEFATLYNAASVCPAYLEPYLVKVMSAAKKALPAKFEELHNNVRVFTLQEMQHCKQHIAFNRMLRKAYPEIEPLEKAYEADYDRFLKTKSLQFNIAYSEGFEAMSAIPTTCFFEDFDEYWEKSDPRAEALWKWHLAEEYEHREVMHDLYRALYGNGPRAYLYRLYGFFYAMVHITKHVRGIGEVMLRKDRENMTPDELAASKAREKKVNQLAWKHAKRHMKKIVSPFYDPSKRQPPRGVAEILASAEAPVPIAGGIGQPLATAA